MQNHTELITDNTIKAKWAQRLVWSVMLIDLIGLFSSYFQYNLLIAVQNQEFITEEMVASNDLREQVVSIIYLMIYITSAVFFIRWFKSAYSNLAKRSITNEKESMAIWSWFIPFISLYKPYLMMKEMFTDSSLKIRLKDQNYKEKDTDILGFWWFLWISTNIIGNFIFRANLKSETVEDFIQLTITDMILSALSVPLAILAYIIIEQYNEIEVKLAKLETEENNASIDEKQLT